MPDFMDAIVENSELMKYEVRPNPGVKEKFVCSGCNQPVQRAQDLENEDGKTGRGWCATCWDLK